MSRINTSEDRRRAVSRHTLSYILCSISELFRHYDFDPLDLLLIHAVLNANVMTIMKDSQLDQKFAGLNAVEPDEIKQGVSRSALGGLIVSQANRFKFGDNHALQITNMVLVKKLLVDLRRVGISGPDDL